MSYAPALLAAAGDSAEAFRRITAMERQPSPPWFVDVEYATTYFALGDSTRGFVALDRSVNAMPAGWIVFIPFSSPVYDKVRGTPHFHALLRRSGVGPAAIDRLK
jgi:hypothetical protein